MVFLLVCDGGVTQQSDFAALTQQSRFEAI
jgi:hypothetical protein